MSGYWFISSPGLFNLLSVSLFCSNLTPLLTLPDRWWAHEHGRKEIISLLKKAGVSEKRRDKDGITPLELNEDEL